MPAWIPYTFYGGNCYHKHGLWSPAFFGREELGSVKVSFVFVDSGSGKLKVIKVESVGRQRCKPKGTKKITCSLVNIHVVFINFDNDFFFKVSATNNNPETLFFFAFFRWPFPVHIYPMWEICIVLRFRFTDLDLDWDISLYRRKNILSDDGFPPNFVISPKFQLGTIWYDRSLLMAAVLWKAMFRILNFAV